MQKKKVKKEKKISKKIIKHGSSRRNVSGINNKLDQIILMQKRLLKEDYKIEKEEDVLEKEERETENIEKKEYNKLTRIESEIKSKEQNEEEELMKLQQLEEEIKKEVGEHPLRKVGFRDVVKGLIGSFIGLAVHYTFIYGVEISESINVTRATFLFILAFFVGILFIYATGFRKIKDPKILMFMPVRFLVLYVASIIMSILVLYIFYPSFGHEFWESYRMVGGVLLAAVVGACTADLIGKE